MPITPVLGYQSLQALVLPIVRWCVRLGIGYGQFSRIVKPLFFAAAQQEINEKKLKPTGAAFGLISGLSKNDIDAFKVANNALVAERDFQLFEEINPASQVVARWVALGLPKRLPFKGGKESFFELTKVIQSRFTTPGLSTRLLLQDLVRRGLVKVDAQIVELISEIGLPNLDTQESVVHVTGAVRDHMLTCLSNLEIGSSPKYLEQCLSADGLSAESVETIHAMSRVWWMQALRAIGPEAISLSERDEPNGGHQRLRLGVYFYTEDASNTSQPNFPR